MKSDGWKKEHWKKYRQQMVWSEILRLSLLGSERSHLPDSLKDKLEREGVLNPPNGITIRDYRLAYENGVNPADSRVRLTAAIRFQLLFYIIRSI